MLKYDTTSHITFLIGEKSNNIEFYFFVISYRNHID